MHLSTRAQALLRGARYGARFARVVVLSIFLPTKILTALAERDRLAG